MDNVIFHSRLSDRNYGCRRRPRYMIFSQFSIYCCQNAFASGALSRTPPGGFQRPQLTNVGSYHCRGPHRIAGLRAPIPRYPPLWEDDEEHLNNLSLVLEKIYQAGLRLKRSKCQFMKEKIVALGRVLSGQGIQPSTAKLEAIQNDPAPSNVTELRAYLGLINYYHRYLRNLSSVLAPLHDLLKKGIPWSWNASHQKAFDTSKQQLRSETVLVHYDLDKKLILSCDASPYGVGAVLSHVMEYGSETPIGFA